KACLRLTLLVEELFTNTIVHGHGADTESPVSLAFEIQPGAIGLTYEDMARPYDPFARVRVPDAALGVEEQPVGGLGVVLVPARAGASARATTSRPTRRAPPGAATRSRGTNRSPTTSRSR